MTVIGGGVGVGEGVGVPIGVGVGKGVGVPIGVGFGLTGVSVWSGPAELLSA